MAARFDAFISYSRAASSALAVELRLGIERFAKPWYRLRSSRVFLDDASMSANTGLWSTIENGLTEAEWFILLCSPASAASQYVTNEIAWWLGHKSSDRMLLVLDEGEILWDAAAGDFDWSRATAVNPALSKAFAEEPRWVDLSWFEQPESLGSSDPRFPERVADLASAVRGIERDELVGENVRARRRALRLLRGGVIALSGLLVASLVATVIAVSNGNAAAEQARIAQARQLAAQAIVASSDDLQFASLLAVEAVRLHDDAQTRAALFQLQNASRYLVRSLDVGSKVTATTVVAGGTVITGSEDGRVLLWNGSRSHDVFTMPGRVVGVAVSTDGDIVAGVTSDAGGAVGVSTEDGVQQLDLDLDVVSDRLPTYVAVSPDGGYLVVSDRLNWTTLYARGADGYAEVGSVEVGGRAGFGDGEITLFNPGGGWGRVSLADGKLLDAGQHVLPQTFLTALSADGRVLAGSDRSVNYPAWYADAAPPLDDGTDPSDLVATSTIAGALDMALNDDGSLLATQTTGAIYVSRVRGLDELPAPPMVLDGAGEVNFETLSFAGDHLVNGSGDHALVWDLAAAGRITREFEAPVPEGCTACGVQEMRTNGSGTRLLMTDQSAFTTVATDLVSGESVPLAPEGGSYSGAAWFDDERVIAYDADAAHLFVLSGDHYQRVDLSVPLALPDGAHALMIRSDGSPTGRVTVIDDLGDVVTVDLGTGETVASTELLTPLFDGQAPAGFGIAPDQSTAYLWFYGGAARYIDIAADRVVYDAENVDAMTYDGTGALHVFAKSSEWVVDRGTGALGTGRPAKVEGLPSSPTEMTADGRLAATGGATGVVTLLDLDARSTVVGRITVPAEDDKHVVSIFTPDGTSLVMSIQQMFTIARPPTVRVIDLTLPGWITASCAVAGRDLTPDEWLTYVGTTPPADLRCDR